ncbi:hypothetical protein [Nonomuraea sp. NPDC049695]|uniref:hypothetical protein n=1 Tax=Nonomuraea sp. NPDC049695 TaxID=3154734 RepID=UPI003442E518
MSMAYEGLDAAMELPTADVAEVLGLDGAVGLKVCALHERSHARDIVDVASVSHLYSFRALESLAKVHYDGRTTTIRICLASTDRRRSSA